MNHANLNVALIKPAEHKNASYFSKVNSNLPSNARCAMYSLHQLLSFCVILISLIHGFCAEESSHAEDCLAPCSHGLCQGTCDHLMTEIDHYLQVDEDAGANVTLHCRGVNLMMISFYLGTYIIEQSTLDNIWGNARVSRGRFETFTNLTAGVPYRYRLHRLTNNGITRSEISDWFSTFEVDYQLHSVEHIALSKVEADENDVCQLHAEISFEPAADRSCSYNVLLWSGEHNLFNFYLRKLTDYRFSLHQLGFDQTNNLSISSTNEYGTHSSNKTSITFNTPSCLAVYNNLTICAPERVKGLAAEHTYVHRGLYSIKITWDAPEQEPNNYTVQLDALQDEHLYHVTVPGNFTEVDFTKLELGFQYEVSIIAESIGGISPTSSIVKTVDIEHENWYKFYGELMFGLLVLVTFVILVGMICLQHYRQKSKHFTIDYTHFESLDPKDSKSDTTKKLLHDDHASADIDCPPVHDAFELSSKLLKLKGILGSGAYGIVQLGSLEDEFNNVTDVAIKMMRDNPSVDDIRNFHQEILIMKSTSQHPNIVSLIGCSTLFDNPVLVVEYCCKGDLQTYLRTIWQNMVSVTFDQRVRFRFDAHSFTDSGIEYLSNDSGRIKPCYQNVRMIANRLYDIQGDVTQCTEPIDAGDLLNFARQIATGMEFLSSNRIIHRDLAARNVLVCADKIVKISDFGLSRDIYQENVYRKQGNGKLPLKWMAIEAITHQIYTTYSDIWSFGILLWEIVTMGALPYPGIAAESLLKLLISGYRMERPPSCSIELYKIMLSCWNTTPQSRPLFTEVKESLDKLLSCYSENKYLNITEALQDPHDQCHISSET